MTFHVLVSATAARQLAALPKADRRRVMVGLAALQADPVTSRPGADIKALHATSPRKHRLRVGAFRIVYLCDGDDVKVIDVFRRGREYR